MAVFYSRAANKFNDLAKNLRSNYFADPPPFNVGLLTNDTGWQVCNTSGGDKATAIIGGVAQSLADETRVQFEAASHQFHVNMRITGMMTV